MSDQLLSPAELLTLPPTDLRDLVNLVDGPYISARAAVLGLDVDVPEHRTALLRAFPDAFTGLSGDVPAGQPGVRAALTPEPSTAPDPTDDDQGAGDDAQRAAQPAEPETLDLVEMLDRYRGSREPFLVGTFALYSAPDGAIVAVTDIPGRGVEQRAIPGQLVRLALNPNAGKMLGRLIGGAR